MKQESGFTLIETLIAVLLISLAIVTFLSTTSRGMNTTRQALNQTIAQTLAQEGIELVRNVRDSNFLSGGQLPWDSGLTNCVVGCSISQWPNPVQLNPCTSMQNACAELRTDQYGRYMHNQNMLAGATPFKRIVTITPSGDGIVVTSYVGWGEDRQVKVTAYLTNWFRALPQTGGTIDPDAPPIVQ